MLEPTVQGDGEVVRCQRCGAVVPLVSGAGTRCLYCLAPCEIPATIATPLRRDAALAEEIREQLELAAGHARTLRWGLVLGWGLFGLPPLLYFLGALAYTVNEAVASQPPATRVMVIALSLETLVFVAAFFGGNLWRGARAVVLHTAARPFAAAVVGDGTLRATCAACGGAVHPLADGLLGACVHCRAESLLPLPLVKAHLRRRHQAVVAARLHNIALGKGPDPSAGALPERTMHWMIGGFVVISTLTMVGGVIAQITGVGAGGVGTPDRRSGVANSPAAAAGGDGHAVGGTVANADRVIAGMSAGFRACRREAPAHAAGFAGTVQVTAVIGANGEVVVASPIPAGSVPSGVVDCVVRRVKSASFSPPAEGASVLHITAVP